MMTAAELRAFALSLPEAREAPHFDRTSFRVANKIFSTMTASGDEAMVKVAPRERIEDLLATMPEVFFDYGGFTWKMGALGVRLTHVDPALMRQLVSDAWKMVSAKPKARAAPRRPPRRPRS